MFTFRQSHKPIYYTRLQRNTQTGKRNDVRRRNGCDSVSGTPVFGRPDARRFSLYETADRAFGRLFDLRQTDVDTSRLNFSIRIRWVPVVVVRMICARPENRSGRRVSRMIRPRFGIIVPACERYEPPQVTVTLIYGTRSVEFHALLFLIIFRPVFRSTERTTTFDI